MIFKNWKREILTIPNMLSLFRLVMIPFYVYIYLNATSNSDYFLAAAMLAVSCLTDLIDGKIARHFDMISTVGKILDPLADKLTQLAIILCLAMKYPILQYLFCLFVLKESFQLIAGSINLHKGKVLKGALTTGKICTTILFISLILLVLLPDINKKYVTVITVIDAVFMVVAFADYISAYSKRESEFQTIDESLNHD